MQNQRQQSPKPTDPRLANALGYVGRLRRSVLQLCDGLRGISPELDRAIADTHAELDALSPASNIEGSLNTLRAVISDIITSSSDNDVKKQLTSLEFDYIDAFASIFETLKRAKAMFGDNDRARESMRLDLSQLSDAAESGFETARLRDLVLSCTRELRATIDSMQEREQQYKSEMNGRIEELEAKLADASLDTAKLKAALAENTQRLRTDSLTGAGSRGAYDEFCRELAFRTPASPALSIIVIDIDRFKLINDTYGHDSGDAIIVEVCARIRKSLREADSFFRFGGEEFVVFTQASLVDASQIADRARRQISAAPFTLHGGTTIAVTISAGVTELAPAEPIDKAFSRADEALYAAKRNGRNMVVRTNA